MKIALVCSHFYPHIGGVETVVLQVASNLAASGNDVTVITQTNNNKLANKERLRNFTILRFNEFGLGNLKISIRLLTFLYQNSKRYDLIHVQNYHTFPALCVALTKKVPTIFSPHYHGTGHSFLTHLIHYPYRYIGSYIFSKSDLVICDTQAESNLVRTHFPQVGEIAIISLGIDVEGIQKAKKIESTADYILTIGRLEKYKNIDLIIKSLKFIKSDIGLKIIGTGPIIGELQNLVQKQSLTSRVSFLGNVPEQQLQQSLKSAKAYITMSSMEAYGLSLLEAVAAKIGVVASDIPSHRDLVEKFKINNVSLLKLETTSPQKIAESISTAVVKPSQAIENLPSWNIVTSQLFNVYKEQIYKVKKQQKKI